MGSRGSRSGGIREVVGRFEATHWDSDHESNTTVLADGRVIARDGSQYGVEVGLRYDESAGATYIHNHPRLDGALQALSGGDFDVAASYKLAVMHAIGTNAAGQKVRFTLRTKGHYPPGYEANRELSNAVNRQAAARPQSLYRSREAWLEDVTHRGAAEAARTLGWVYTRKVVR